MAWPEGEGSARQKAESGADQDGSAQEGMGVARAGQGVAREGGRPTMDACAVRPGLEK